MSTASGVQISGNVEIAAICVALLWGVFFLNLILPFDLRNYGIRPRSISGLPGILFAPFLHTGARHLISNSLAWLPCSFFLWNTAGNSP